MNLPAFWLPRAEYVEDDGLPRFDVDRQDPVEAVSLRSTVVAGPASGELGILTGDGAHQLVNVGHALDEEVREDLDIVPRDVQWE